jgi:hypothetical protein
MENIKTEEYTFDHWLKGYPEPTGLNWIYISTTPPKYNPVYLEISNAKKYTFDKAFEFTLDGIKKKELDRIEKLTDSKKKLFLEKKIQDSEKYFQGFDVIKLIEYSPPNKFDGIDGSKYLAVKKQVEGLKSGKYSFCFKDLNEGFFAVLYFELNEFYKDLLNKKDDPEKITEKSHRQKIRTDLEPKYRFYLMDKLGMIDPKGIFYDSNLSLNERAKLLSKILGYNERECKDLLNSKTHFNEEKKYDLDDFLNDLNKKRKK